MKMRTGCFREQEIEPLQRKYHVDTEAKVKEKLFEEGRSIEAMRLSNRQTQLSSAYLGSKIRDRIKVELPELLKFYNDHVYEHEFDQPAQVTWREVVVEVAKHKGRAEAKWKADTLLEKLRRGGDFAKLARTESDGLTSSRNDGGLMHTTPGSYADETINKALDTLPIGQLSEVIEGPWLSTSLKVENRRPAGPASFEGNVEIRSSLLLEAKRSLRKNETAFLKKLKPQRRHHPLSQQDRPEQTLTQNWLPSWSLIVFVELAVNDLGGMRSNQVCPYVNQAVPENSLPPPPFTSID